MSEFARNLRMRADLDAPLIMQPQRGHLTYGDKNADKIIVEVVRGSQEVTLDGVTAGATFYAPPSRAEINLEAAINGNRIEVTLAEACYAAEGYYQLEVYLSVMGQKVTVLSICGNVHRAGNGVIIDATGTIPSIDDLLSMISDIDAAKQAAYDAAGVAAAAAAALEGMRAYARTVAYESGANVTVENQGGRYVLTFNIPRGAPGTINNVGIDSIPGLRDALNERMTKDEASEYFFPVGFVFASMEYFDPNERYGGVWERLENVVIYGASDEHPVGERGGSETVSLTGEQNGPHTHGLKITKNKAASGSALARIDTDSSTPSGSLVTESGGGEPHENMMPYITAYMWMRVE